MKNEFVVGWVTSNVDNECWLMVLNKKRGWELPGGKIEDNERIEEAILRELFEETGLLGIAKAYDESIVDGGYVVWIEVADEPTPIAWESNDDAIQEVGWCIEIPERIGWSIDELNKIRNHDWSTSKTLGS
ncbi:MAG: NUDIX domain-containing protein [Euryarchaeota archaeon]|jgi:8-oxo-dGTP pyrophosphatase MutT (NUDIX family)|nr:NUDIX domain-containing protein [Euryarchaeota archaeon]MBT4802506.1 NUDIX domain-containing protein [Euryarchaeota archaeon]